VLIEWSWQEPEIFAELYDRHAAPVHRYVSRRLSDAMADDVVADTFLAAFRRRQGYDLRRPDVRPWLYGIVSPPMAGCRRSCLTRRPTR